MSILLSFTNSDVDFLRPKLDAIVERTASAPLINLLGAVLKDWMPLIDEYYYCKYAICLYSKHPLIVIVRYGAVVFSLCFGICIRDLFPPCNACPTLLFYSFDPIIMQYLVLRPARRRHPDTRQGHK